MIKAYAMAAHLTSRRTLTLLAPAMLLASAALLAQDTTPGAEGLVPRQVRGFDQVSERPGVIWSDYDKVIVSDVEVTFSGRWDPRIYGRFGLDPRQVAKMRGDLAALAKTAFVESLVSGGQVVATANEAGVLQVVPKIIDLYVNAPPRNDLSPLYTYVLESGEMTLVLELRDSVTGTLLGQIRDRYRDPGIGVFVLANEVSQQAENRRVLRAWAEHLRSMLNGAQARPASGPATNPR